MLQRLDQSCVNRVYAIHHWRHSTIKFRKKTTISLQTKVRGLGIQKVFRVIRKRIQQLLLTDRPKINYGLHLHQLPKNYVCEQKFNAEQALSCKKGRFIKIRHNQVRDTTAKLLKFICNDVKIEPPLLPLSGASLSERTACIQDTARVDLTVRGFLDSWTKDIF